MLDIVEEKHEPSNIENQPLPWSVGFAASVSQSFFDNPISKLGSFLQTEVARANDVLLGEEKLSRQQVIERAKLDGVKVELNQESYYPSQAQMIIDRQRDRATREAIMAKSDLGSAGRFFGGLIGSVPDPANIAVSAIPLGGEAYWGAKLGLTAETALSRAGIRAAQGAVSGAVGAAAIEPVNYGLSKALGDEYSATNSFMNIAFGGVMGAVFHVGGGAIADRFAAPKELGALPKETQMEMHQAALVQALEDRPIDITPIVRREIVSAEKRAALARKLDPEAFAKFEEAQGRVATASEARAILIEKFGSDKAEDLELAILLKEINEEIKSGSPEVRDAALSQKAELLRMYGPEKFDTLPQAPERADFEAFRQLNQDLQAAKADHKRFEPRVSGAYQKADKRIRRGKVKGDVVQETVHPEDAQPSFSTRPLPETLPPPENFPSSPEHVLPHSERINPELEARQVEVLKESKHPADDYEALAQLKESTETFGKDLEAEAKAAGIPEEDFKAAHEDAKMMEKLAREYTDALKEMSTCLLSGGEE